MPRSGQEADTISDVPDLSNRAFLQACRSKPTDRTPVWFMRQAGRSLPEYKALKGTTNILEAIKSPELAAEITLQPVRRYGVDAAILYSDIVVPVHALGFGVDIQAGIGPVVGQPFRTRADLDRLRPLEPEADVPYVLETVRLLVKELDVPLIGFAGAPFTVASYLLEGKPSRDYVETRRLLWRDPELFAALLDRLADIALASLRSQVEAGASAVQLFDSWAGALDPDDYERAVLPSTQKIFAGLADLGVPRIASGVGTSEILSLWAAAGADVVSVDSTITLDEARRRVGEGVGVQGNLDPWAVAVAPWEAVEAKTRAVLASNAGRPGHVFNLGHGVRPETDPDTLQRIVDLVHASVSATASHGVLLMAYGTPEREGDLEAYYTDIRRGRPPAPEQLADLRRRYDAIGGLSPLAERTRAQARGLQRVLDERAGAGAYRVELGLKHAGPSIEAGVEALAAAGVEDFVSLVLAPHFSALSVGQYLERAADAAGHLKVRDVTAWWDSPALVELLAERVRAAVASSGASNIELLVTAHSLPVRALAIDHPTYEEQLRATGELVAAAAGVGSWRIAWQSAGRTPEPWIGPDILDVVRSLPGEGYDGVVVCPAGFTSDHLEVLYDVDIEAKAVAEEAGLALVRTASLNDDPRFLSLLADLVTGS